MARMRRTITLDEKIEKAQVAVFQAKDKYDAAMEELNALQKKKKDLESKELLKLFEKSPKTFEEVKAFLQGNSDQDEV